MKCKICGNTENNHTLTVQEMMFGLREKFLYSKCASCGCLQIIEPPNDLSKYYQSDNYYSLISRTSGNSKLKQFLKQLYIDCYYFNIVPEGKFVKSYPFFRILKELKLKNRQISILDIGSGTGRLIRQLYFTGYKDIMGIDPFIEQDILNDSFIIYKKDVLNFSPGRLFDLIMMHHSLEHIAEQHETLDAISKIMKPKGMLLIRVPLCDSYAFRKFKGKWFQIDAPRHFFIHTVKSIQFLSEKHGYYIQHVIYDSTESQFINSEKYCRDITLYQKMYVHSKRLRFLKRQAKILNNLGDGDMACFVLRKA